MPGVVEALEMHKARGDVYVYQMSTWRQCAGDIGQD